MLSKKRIKFAEELGVSIAVGMFEYCLLPGHCCRRIGLVQVGVSSSEEIPEKILEEMDLLCSQVAYETAMKLLEIMV
jgi:hypothetical protein